MSRFNNVLEAVGATPLIRLNHIGSEFGSEIFVKFEAVNPGGSIKDRIGRHIIDAAERKGLLKPGGTIIEATAGNTGAGLALAAAVKGYRLIVVMPDKMSAEKIALLKAFGAEVVITPTAVAPDSPENYIQKAKALAASIPNSFRAAHYLSTGPEIWADMEGRIDALVGGIGTGGTISGTGRFLKEKNPALKVIGADPEGSVLSGDTPHTYKVEGIGEDYFPVTYDKEIVDQFFRISDGESFRTARRLVREEGIFAGGSSGTALAAALRYAATLKEPQRIAVILPDTGRNYLSKIFNDDWMKQNGYLD